MKEAIRRCGLHTVEEAYEFSCSARECGYDDAWLLEDGCPDHRLA